MLAMNLIKLAFFFCAKYNLQAADQWPILPDEGIPITPDYQPGDLVRDKRNKRLAKFVSYMHWDPKHHIDYREIPSKARIVYVREDGSNPGHTHASDVDILDIEKVNI